jgi:hypothetical protein
VELLLRFGASFDEVEDKEGMTPHDYAKKNVLAKKISTSSGSSRGGSGDGDSSAGKQKHGRHCSATEDARNAEKVLALIQATLTAQRPPVWMPRPRPRPKPRNKCLWNTLGRTHRGKNGLSKASLAPLLCFSYFLKQKAASPKFPISETSCPKLSKKKKQTGRQNCRRLVALLLWLMKAQKHLFIPLFRPGYPPSLSLSLSLSISLSLSYLHLPIIHLFLTLLNT